MKPLASGVPAGLGGLLGLGLMCLAAAARAQPATEAIKPEAKPEVVIETPAQRFIKTLPTDPAATPPPRRVNSGEYINPRVAVVLDEIRVYGQVEPEDYVKRKHQMRQFRERLEKDKRLTPKEKTQLALCFIGVCGLYGPEGIPVEGPIEERTEARVQQTTTQLNSQFKGTLQ